MWRRKRNLPPRKKPPRIVDNAADDVRESPNVDLPDAFCQEQSKIESFASEAYASVKLECNRALAALSGEDHEEALRLIKEVRLRHQDCALIYRVQSFVYRKLASLIDDDVAKQRLMKNAVESSRRAITLSPNSIEFSAFYANLLFEVASNTDGYQEVITECERAMSIDNPIDPAEESLLEPSESKASTVEARIALVLKELGSVLDKSKHALETAINALDERRTEVELKIKETGARLLPQNFDYIQVENGDERAFTLNPENKLEKRRKQALLKRIETFARKRDQFQSYWNSINDEKRRGFLEFRIRDLRWHFRSSKDGLAAVIFSEAIDFAQKNKTWKFWGCCFCDEKFIIPEMSLNHLVEEHKRDIVQLQYFVPQKIDADWADMIVNGTWKPVDTARAMEIMEKQSKCKLANVCDQDSMQGCIEGIENGLEENLVQLLKNNCSCQEDLAQFSYEEPNKGHGYIPEFSSGESDGSLLPIADSDVQKWPLSDDINRANILERIHDEFQLLLSHKSFSMRLLNRVIQYTIEALQNYIPASQLRINGLDQTPLCICFLEMSKLREVLKFLKIVSELSGLTGKGYSLGDALNNSERNEIKEHIVFIGDPSCLLLDECSLRVQFMPPGDHDAVADDGSAATCTIRANEDGDVLPDSDALIHWLFDGPSIGEDLASWMLLKTDMKCQVLEVYQKFEKPFNLFERLNREGTAFKKQKDAIKAIESIYIQELEESKNEKHVPQSYASLLRRRQQQLLGADHVASCSSRFELEAIKSILKEAQALDGNQPAFEEALTRKHSLSIDLSISDDMHQEDFCIAVAIQRQIEQADAELCKIHAEFVKTVSVLRQLGLKFKQASNIDYRAIMLPLLKSFMQAHMEALVNEEAKQKSNAAVEAFLSELEQDAKKNTSKGGKKHKKAKKKNKGYKKLNDPKDNCGDKLNVLQEEHAEQAHFLVDSDYLSSKIVVTESADELKLREEELKHITEREEEERKLEEKLEYQRLVEDEAKQKLLAKQHENAVSPRARKLGEIVASEKLEYCKPLNLSSGDNVTSLSSSNVSNGNDIASHQFFPSVHNQKVDLHDSPQIFVGTMLLNLDGRIANSYGMPSQYPLVGKSMMPEDFSAVPASDFEETKVLNNSYRASASQRTRRRRFRSHGMVNQEDALQAQKNLALTTSQSVPLEESTEEDGRVFSTDATFDNISGSDAFGPGLRNDVGEYNCFLNVIVQSLWHLSKFRDDFLSRSTSVHMHIGDPCVVCALQEVLNALSVASANMQREAVSPTSLRIALSKLYPDGNFFQEAQMNDASEVLAVIFDCLHQSFTSGSGVSPTESSASKCPGSWDCAVAACIAHKHFGIEIFEKMSCYNSCDLDAKGCGKLNTLHRILSTPPYVFTIVLGWQTSSESIDDISATFTALSTEIDIGVLYEGLGSGNIYSLISMACYFGRHYICFAYSHKHEKWIMYDDETVKVIGSWEDVTSMCESGHIQPQVLFFEAVN
ncbi:hypothetical protein U1Q18_038462 [Sarracenia purpurea var. burkii]